MKTESFDLKVLVQEVTARPAPKSCAEIAQLLECLPPRGSLSSGAPVPEQKMAFELLSQKAEAPTAQEILFMADICCGRYHRIRRDGDIGCFDSKKAETLYRRYYEAEGCPKVKYILDNFSEFAKLCGKSVNKRQRHDDFELYCRDTPLSTSRDTDSSEWKG